METIKLTSEQNAIYFMQGDGDAEILKLCENGDIFFKGKLAENDKQVVDALREFLKGQGLYNVVEHEVQLCRFCKVGDTNNDFGCTNPKCEMYPFQ